MLKLIQKALICFCLMLPVSMVLAEEAENGQKRDQLIAAVIEDQIAAFREKDGDRAFSHASPQIKSIFKNAKRFNSMVQRTYTMIYSPQFHQLEDLKEVDGLIIQSAIFVGEGQQTVRAYYEMQLQGDGSWKINGVFVENVDDKIT